MDNENGRMLSWEAAEHHHKEHTSDWYWALGVISIAVIITAIVFGNILFAVVVLLASLIMAIFAMRGPLLIQYTVGPRGVRVGDELFPYTSLESFCIDEDNPAGPQLFLKSERLFMPLMIIPLPEEYVDVVDTMLSERLPEEHMEESLFHRLLEFFGF